MSTGILTSGGLCPGVNNAIRHITIAEKRAGNIVYGFMDGFKGLNEDHKYRIDIEDLYDETGSILRMSREPLDIEMARPALKRMDRLWCIGGHGTMAAAKVIAADEKLNVNVIGIAKSINNDVPGIRETLGFQTAINEMRLVVERAHIHALTTRSVVFVEAPGQRSGALVRNVGMAAFSKCQVVISPESYEDHLYDVDRFFASDGYCVVLVSEGCECNYIRQHIEQRYDIKTHTIKPSLLIATAPTNAYDTILSVRMVTEAMEYAKTRRNFIKGGSNVIDLV
jgi:6-phosphofructokinase 1